MPSFESTANTAQAHLDEDIYRLAHKLSTLQTQRNALAPISRLPTPALARIFRFYARDDYGRSQLSDIKMRPSRWIDVSYVCRHWRHVALTCPSLWSDLFAVSPFWTRVLLARSLDFPLRMSVELFSSKIAIDFLAQVALHTERLEECCIDFKYEWSVVAHAMSVLVSRAPLLRTLKIRLQSVAAPTEHEESHVVNNFMLFGGDMPLLQELELNRYHMPWCSPMLGGLTTLDLRDLATSVRPTVAELKAVLARSPNLERLYLKNALRSDGPSCQGCDKLCMPSLVWLGITSPISDVVALLSCVEIPSTEVGLVCHQSRVPRVDDFVQFNSFLSRWSTSLTPVRSICFHGPHWQDYPSMTCTFEKSKEDLALYSDHYEPDIPLNVTFDPWPFLPLQNDDLMKDISRSMSLAHLESLDLRNFRLSSTTWTDAFGNLVKLRSIALIGDGLSDLIETLSVRSPPSQPTTQGPERSDPCQVFAPSLEEIILKEINFLDGEVNEDMVEPLFRALERRQKEGGTLKLLVLNQCQYLVERDVELLSNVVGYVQWDGDEFFEDGGEWGYFK